MKYYCIYVYFIILSCQIFLSNGLNSKITFEHGMYKNILVALDPELDSSLCANLIEDITNIFQSTASYLQQATNSRANFESIKILIPYQWNTKLQQDCNLNDDDSIIQSNYDTYEQADFKITHRHPFAKSAPWTKQYRNCGNESEAVFVPVDFLRNQTFDLPSKGRQLLHEWLKFRYGVFEEYGYYGDALYSPCYTKNRNLLYSSCSENNNGIDPLQYNIGEAVTAEQCRILINNSSASLNSQLSKANPSIMYNPHLFSGSPFCTNVSHNGINPSKQNMICERKSVSEVVHSHQDFNGQKLGFNEKPLFPPARLPRNLPSVSFVMQKWHLTPAYFFIIEDTDDIRINGRLRHVKQAISQFTKMATHGTLAFVYRYNGKLVAYSPKAEFDKDTLVDEAQRIKFLTYVPDIDASPLAKKSQTKVSNKEIRSLEEIFRNVFDEMKRQGDMFKWEMVLIVSSPPTFIDGALSLIRTNDYPISILTFDESKDWLKFNTVHNTRKVVLLPYCFDQSTICHGKTSSLIAEHLFELISKTVLPNVPGRFFHKVVDVLVYGTAPTTFTISTSVPGWSNFYLMVPVYDNSTVVTINPPQSTIACSMTHLLGYSAVQIVNNCPYRIGEWTVSISGSQAVGRQTHIVQGYVETTNTEHDLTISTSFGVKLESEVFPTTNSRFPIYTSVTNKLEQPIVLAKVYLDIFYQINNAFQFSNQTELFDDGEDPDITRDDGVYSGFITTFNPNPSFHSGVISVTTSSTSKALTGFINEAALLDSTMNSRCCGSSVLYSETQTTLTGFSTYSVIMPSFRTGESHDPEENIFPPSKIHSPIRIIEEGAGYVIIQFLAPGADHKYNIVSHYNICCTSQDSGNLDDKMCADIATAQCQPVPYNTEQDCQLSLLEMYRQFFGGENPDNETSQLPLYCGIRGVDAANNTGPMSSSLFEVLLDFEVLEALDSNKCKSISDGCLPIEIFWALIGCIGGLFIILFIVVLCWFCSNKNSKNSPAENEKSAATAYGMHPTLPSQPLPLNNVYINEAYIQDSNGHLKLVASDGQIFESVLGNSESSPIARRRRSIPHGDIPHQYEQHDPNNYNNKKYVSWSNDVDQTKQDMPVFFSNSNASHDNSPRKQKYRQNVNSSSTLPPPYTSQQVNDGGNGPKAKTRRNPKITHNYTNPRFPVTTSNLPSISGTIQDDNMGPIYASVSRAARKSSPSGSPYTNRTSSSPYRTSDDARRTQFSPSHSTSTFIPRAESVPVAERNARPHHISHERAPNAHPPRPVTKQNLPIIALPPVRLDHFPSSESETYSDMSHIIASAIKPDRTPPAAMQPSIQTPAQTRPQSVQRQNSPQKIELFSKSPPKENGFGGQGGGRGSVGRPQYQPPPPPRRQSQSIDHTNPHRPNPSEIIPTKYHSTEDFYDDDSDEWGNYDEDITFPPMSSSQA